MSANDDLAHALAAALASAGISGEVVALERLSGGASRETWSFTCDGRPLVVQRERSGAVGNGRTPIEAALLRAARNVGVPVPAIVVDRSAGEDGAPYLVLEHVPGEAIPRKLLRDDEYAAARPLLATQCGAILAAVHRIPVDAAPQLDDSDQLTSYRGILDALGDRRPALELGFRWLEQHRPPSSAAGLVHGDFRTGNLLVSERGVEAVLDWELAHVGDPLEDLGWFCVRSWRFGSRLPAGGFGTREQLWAGYETAGGAPVDPDAARWWEAFGCLRWAVICLMQERGHLDGLARSVVLATIGRRVCESESDLLALVAGEDWE